MKEFKVSIGLAEDSMVEVLHASLKDDAQPETFSLRSTDKSLAPVAVEWVNGCAKIVAFALRTDICRDITYVDWALLWPWRRFG